VIDKEGNAPLEKKAIDDTALLNNAKESAVSHLIALISSHLISSHLMGLTILSLKPPLPLTVAFAFARCFPRFAVSALMEVIIDYGGSLLKSEVAARPFGRGVRKHSKKRYV
jgi:hypothetical protein